MQQEDGICDGIASNRKEDVSGERDVDGERDVGNDMMSVARKIQERARILEDEQRKVRANKNWERQGRTAHSLERTADVLGLDTNGNSE